MLAGLPRSGLVFFREILPGPVRLMPAYLVRLIETHDLVGIYSVESIQQLIVLIDECTDPESCEYTRFRAPGGIMWGSPAVSIPVERQPDADGSEPDPIPWEGASFTERWWNLVYGYDRSRWKRFYPDDPVEPSRIQPHAETNEARVIPFKKRLD